MTTKSILAGLGGKVLMLAAVFTLGFILSSCGGDDDDNSNVYTNKSTVNGVTKNIWEVNVQTVVLAKNRYYLSIYLSKDNAEHFMIDLSALYDGQIIDISKKEQAHDGRYWVIKYQDASYKVLAHASGYPDKPDDIFKNGTMYVKRIGTTGTDFEIRIKGTVLGMDKKTDYNIDLNWKGTAKGVTMM